MKLVFGKSMITGHTNERSISSIRTRITDCHLKRMVRQRVPWAYGPQLEQEQAQGLAVARGRLHEKARTDASAKFAMNSRIYGIANWLTFNLWAWLYLCTCVRQL